MTKLLSTLTLVAGVGSQSLSLLPRSAALSQHEPYRCGKKKGCVDNVSTSSLLEKNVLKTSVLKCIPSEPVGRPLFRLLLI